MPERDTEFPNTHTTYDIWVSYHPSSGHFLEQPQGTYCDPDSL